LGTREKIIELRKERNWNQKTLAEKSEIAQSSISRYEAGGREIPAWAIRKIADAFGVNPIELIADELGLDRFSKHQNFGDPIIEKTAELMKDMPAEERRKVFEYTEDQKLASEMRKQKAG